MRGSSHKTSKGAANPNALVARCNLSGRNGKMKSSYPVTPSCTLPARNCDLVSLVSTVPAQTSPVPGPASSLLLVLGMLVPCQTPNNRGAQCSNARPNEHITEDGASPGAKKGVSACIAVASALAVVVMVVFVRPVV